MSRYCVTLVSPSLPNVLQLCLPHCLPCCNCVTLLCYICATLAAYRVTLVSSSLPTGLLLCHPRCLQCHTCITLLCYIYVTLAAYRVTITVLQKCDANLGVLFGRVPELLVLKIRISPLLTHLHRGGCLGPRPAFAPPLPAPPLHTFAVQAQLLQLRLRPFVTLLKDPVMQLRRLRRSRRQSVTQTLYTLKP
jgi:hypothetical protein